ncbi:putative transcriptional regulator [Pseudomonas aeruginosa]|nr:putative transcriptional regulator [Pseudomonas aeruginosa]
MPARWSRPSDPSPSRLPRWAPLQRPLFTPVSHGLHRRFFFRNGPRPQPSRSVVAAQALEAPRAVKELPMSEKPRPAPLTFPDADRSPLSIRAKALVFFDPRSHRVREELERLAPQGQPVLIEGETGTGKELLARQIHRHSERAGLFVAVSCSALSRNHAEAELFGYAPGAPQRPGRQPRRLVRFGQWRHPVPGRDRRPAADVAGQAATDAGGTRGAAGRRAAADSP